MRRIWCWWTTLAIQHMGEGISPLRIYRNIGNKTLFREWLPRGKPQHQVMYENKQTFETLKLSSSFSFPFCITSVYKMFWNMFLNNDEESAEAKSQTRKDLTSQKWITEEVSLHVCQAGDYSASSPLLCMKLKSHSFTQHKGLCHPALRTHLPVLINIILQLWQELSNTPWVYHTYFYPVTLTLRLAMSHLFSLFTIPFSLMVHVQHTLQGSPAVLQLLWTPSWSL